ncbi:MAG: 4-hydroxy-tetrahydrodipicolinate reductase [Chlamydiales bacterium]|nr:4-hydroxy-tetrahydrodipicolinate reductase [Chlamydiales bacterium]
MRLGIFGATGRLGKAIGSAALEDPFFTITAALARSSLGVDYGVFLGLSPLHLPVSKSPPLPLPDLFIDVSLPQGLSERLNTLRPMVIGTTGFSEQDFSLLKEASRCIPIFYAANFSLGMAFLKKMATELAELFPIETDIDILEAHRAGKKDTPSGSALHLAQAIKLVRGEKEIPIHSIRSGQTIGEHTLQFNHEEERLSLCHQVHSRKAFAKGALTAARFLVNQPAGLYGMDQLLAEKQTKSRS